MPARKGARKSSSRKSSISKGMAGVPRRQSARMVRGAQKRASIRAVKSLAEIRDRRLEGMKRPPRTHFLSDYRRNKLLQGTGLRSDRKFMDALNHGHIAPRDNYKSFHDDRCARGHNNVLPHEIVNAGEATCSGWSKPANRKFQTAAQVHNDKVNRIRQYQFKKGSGGRIAHSASANMPAKKRRGRPAKKSSSRPSKSNKAQNARRLFNW